MDKQNSAAAGNFNDRPTTQETSTTSKDTSERRRTDILRVQNVHLVWLDKNIDEDNNDCRHILTQLRRIVNVVDTFTDRDQCTDFLTDIDTAKVFMVISGELIQDIVHLIHDVIQLDSIYIFCGNKTSHEEWTRQWPKIKGIFTEISSICDILKQATEQYEHNNISISFMPTSTDVSIKNYDQLDCLFMYTQIWKEIILTLQFEPQHIEEFTDYCRELFGENSHELDNIEKMERTYHEKSPIWWYSYVSVLYSMLNRALRTMDVDPIIKMSFFVHDLHRHIEQLHSQQYGSNQCEKIFNVYRGQGLSVADFDRLLKTKGGLMSFNNFLSTSKDHDVSLLFAESNQSNPDMVGIFFVMSIDPSKSTTPFASINAINNFEAEDEVLFSMHTVFRIHDIKSIGENNRLWQVELTLTSDTDKDLRILTECIREETQPDSKGWYRLSQLLLKIGHLDKAEKVYKLILQQTSDESEKTAVYHQLGRIKDNQGRYEEAITFYEQSLEIYQKTLPPTHPSLTMSYNNIGNVYTNIGDYAKALLYYEKALEIQQKTLPPTHPDLAMFYNNIGTVCVNMGEFSKALLYYEEALEIRQKSLPPTHPDLAMSYNNIGSVHHSMDEFSKALSLHEKAREILQKSLPPTHSDFAGVYNNIGEAYRMMDEYSNALSYYEKALEIQQKTLPPTHADLAGSYSSIGNVYTNIGEYATALSYYEKALEIQQNTLPCTHPALSYSYNNMGVVYKNMSDYSKALSYYEKALEILQKSLPSTHPDLAMFYNNIGEAYRIMGEYAKAHLFYQHAVDIAQESLSTVHPDLQDYRKNLDLVRNKL
jgi:tetratricopeptide (TPR) repeat protein